MIYLLPCSATGYGRTGYWRGVALLDMDEGIL